MGEFHIQGNDFDNKARITTSDLKKAGLDTDKLRTIFDKMDLDSNILKDGRINAKEAKEIMNLFDTDSNNDISFDELSEENIRDVVIENVGGKYTKDESFMNSLTILLDLFTEKFSVPDTAKPAEETTPKATDIGEAIKKEVFKKEDGSGYTLETIGNVTTKTMFGIDGTENKSTTEKWEEGFKNYEKVWTSPSGEKSILKAAGEVIANPDGTFCVPVKREGLGASDEIFTLILDKNGNEVGRFDTSGNEYDSTGNVTVKSFRTLDNGGKITGGYDLDLTGGITKKIRYNADGTKNENFNETWGDKFKDYKKEWNGPNGEKTVLEYMDTVENEDGTFNVTVKRTDSRYPDKIFTLTFDENGKEIDRVDEDGNHYDSTGAPISAKVAEDLAPKETTPPIWEAPIAYPYGDGALLPPPVNAPLATPEPEPAPSAAPAPSVTPSKAAVTPSTAASQTPNKSDGVLPLSFREALELNSLLVSPFFSSPENTAIIKEYFQQHKD